ncbi:SirB2 family protein [Thalassotalea atypica]|uniref:SirB2 family protein n=1 Tax=Thalassotalea atypica TaxID=2054316 RepID=UPI002573833B|nr:SirB2 family protein [Thalassotalea atypica]
MKHLHMTLAVLSVALFILRFAWTVMESQMIQKKWVKISPHVIDTFLFIVGITMAVKLAINPMEQMWLAEKLIAIVAYIFTGYYALKLARNRMMQIFGFLGAMGWVMVVFRIAATKQTFFF